MMLRRQSFSNKCIKVPNYNEKLRSSVTVQEFFFASFEFSPSEFKRSNASTSTDYIWSRPVHCSRAPRCTDSDCHYHSLTSQLAVGINLTMSFVCLSNKYFQRAEGRIFNFKQAKFPNLIILVKKYLCIQASSTEAERSFSALANLLTKRRLRMSGENVNKQLFLREAIKKLCLLKSLS